MSTINTNGIDVNYPVPGVNNNSQGFRDNFAAIKTNLNTAAGEITDLQNKVVVKTALANTVVNNDMANTLISNASTRSFRATTYNLGNSLSGSVVVDASLGDVQYGTVSGNVSFQFGGWAPTGTQSNFQLHLAVSNANAVISFPSEVVFANNNFGVTTLENYANIANTPTVTVPFGVTQLDYRLSSLDCGNSVVIEPINRPRQSTQLQVRSPLPTGYQGDTAGEFCVDPAVEQLIITNVTTSTNVLTTSGNTSQLYTDRPVVFTGVSLEANIVVGTTYYVRNVVSANTFTVSSTIGGSNIAVAANASGTTMLANPVSYMYVCTDTYDANTIGPKYTANTFASNNEIVLNNLTSLANNAPIVFSGNIGGLTANTTYYIKSLVSGNTSITVSRSRTNGIAGTAVTLTNETANVACISYNGSDIWKRITLNNW